MKEQQDNNPKEGEAVRPIESTEEEASLNETPSPHSPIVTNETGELLISEVKRRTSLFVKDNYRDLSKEEARAVHLVIENAMLIGGSIILEQEAGRVTQIPERTEEDRMRYALTKIATHWAINYGHKYSNNPMYRGPYGIGVTDGHRACALMARMGLGLSEGEAVPQIPERNESSEASRVSEIKESNTAPSAVEASGVAMSDNPTTPVGATTEEKLDHVDTAILGEIAAKLNPDYREIGDKIGRGQKLISLLREKNYFIGCTDNQDKKESGIVATAETEQWRHRTDPTSKGFTRIYCGKHHIGNAQDEAHAEWICDAHNAALQSRREEVSAETEEWEEARQRLEHECLITDEPESGLTKDILTVCAALLALQRKNEELQKKLKESEQSYQRLRGAVNGSDPVDLEYIRALEKDNELLQQRLLKAEAELKKS